MKTTTSERLKEIMRSRGLRQVDIIKLCQPYCEWFNVKLQRNDLSQYVSGKVLPPQYKLTILGLALDVSETWLIGYDVAVSRNEKAPSIEIDEDEKMLISLFRCVPDDKKSMILAMIRAVLNTK